MYPHSAKGQFTLFVTLGVVVLALVMISLAFLYPEQVKDLFSAFTLGKDEAEAKYFAEECLKDSAQEGLILIEKQGGYTRPREAVSSAGKPIGYISVDAVQVLRLEDIESDLQAYIEEDLGDCFEEGFEKYLVEQERASVAVQFEEDTLFLDADWELHFIDEEGQASFDVSEIHSKISSSFKMLFAEAERFLSEAPFLDASLQYYEVQNISLRIMHKENMSIAYFSQGEEYFIAAYN